MGKSKATIEREKVIKQVGRALGSYQMVSSGDSILVGLSGGIDSSVMLDILATRHKFLPFGYQLKALHVEAKGGPRTSDQAYLKELCARHGIPLHTQKVFPEEDHQGKKSFCFQCSWQRRAAVFKKARQLGCNKVAFAHHMDDALETLFMNMTFHGEISSIPPRIEMFNGAFELIRPMILTSNAQIESYARHEGIRGAESKCSFEHTSKRETFRQMIENLSQLHPQARQNLYNAMGNIYQGYLPDKPTG